MTRDRSSVLLISMGVLLGTFPFENLAAGIGTTSSKLIIPRIGINRSSKDNGGSLSFNQAEYATHRPYKVDFDLLRASDSSMEIPLLRNNDILDESKDSDFSFLSDPTLRSRRRKKRQVESPQVISATSSDFQRFNLCLPYFNTNPLCRQLFFGLSNSNNAHNPATVHSNLVQSHSYGQPSSALAVAPSASPSSTAYYVPQAFPPSSSISSISSNSAPVVAGGPMISRNDLAILNYYQQQQFPPQQQQAPFQQLEVFQGPIPIQRQRPQYDNIHTKYPYPYPPTEIQAVVPESGNTGEIVEGGSTGVTTDVPSDVVQTTLPQEATGSEQPGTSQQDPAAPVANFPDSAIVQQQTEGNVEVNPSTTYNPAGMISSSPLPPSTQSADLSTPSPSQEQQPSEGSSDIVPVSPGEQNDPSVFQQPPLPPLPIKIQQAIPQPLPDIAMQKRLREKEEEVRQLKSQLEQANLQVVSYENENAMAKDQFMRSEEANIKLRDRVLQLENTNQHLQEQNGQLQQVTSEQRQQINGLKASVKDAKDQLDNLQNQASPMSEESLKHRKEIEDFLIRIRTLGEENETCKKQVKLYQLKVNYIMEQQRQQQQAPQQPQQQPQPQQSEVQQQRLPQKKKQPIASPKLPTAADLTVHDDELDPELSRMDAEIAELQKNADEVAVALQNLPQLEQLSPPVPIQLPESPAVVLKKETEFPGEAVQVDPQQTKLKHQQQDSEQKIATAADVARAESSSRTIPSGGGAPAWEQPAGF